MCITIGIGFNHQPYELEKVCRSAIRTAEADIPCYKVVERNHSCKWFVHTPFRETRVPILCLLGKVAFRAKNKGDLAKRMANDIRNDGLKLLSFNNCGNLQIGGGLIHTYGKQSGADEWTLNSTKKCDVYRCVIPKGTRYVKGTYGCDVESYASECIKFVERM